MTVFQPEAPCTTSSDAELPISTPAVLAMPTVLRAESLRKLDATSQPPSGASYLDDLRSGMGSPATTADETQSSEGGSDANLSEVDEDVVSGAGSYLLSNPTIELPGRKVLVTGGAGFVGSHVADALLTRGDSVIIVDEFNDYYDTRLKRANVAYLIEKHGRTRLRIVEVSQPLWSGVDRPGEVSGSVAG